MIELRWKVIEWTEYPEIGMPIKHTEWPALQYRKEEGPIGEQWWSEWVDVPTVYIEE